MVGSAQSKEYLPLISNVSGHEIGRMYRTDGASPSKTQADIDKKSCLLDPNEISDAVANRINALLRTDRGAAARELARAVTPCMANKGWRLVIGPRDAPKSGNTKATIDAALRKINSLLPRRLDDDSNFVSVRRNGVNIVYTIKVRNGSQAKADELRRLNAVHPLGLEKIRKQLMERRLCEPEPNKFLRNGFAIVWNTFDDEGRLSRTRITAADCK